MQSPSPCLRWAWPLTLALCACAPPSPAPAPPGPEGSPSPAPSASATPGPTAASPSPQPGLASVRGRVFDAQGLPLAGATLRVAGLAEATSGPDGAYLLEGLPPLVNHLVEASAPGRPRRSRVAAFVAGPNEGLDFGRPAPTDRPLAQPIPLRQAEADANFLEPGLELLALAPGQDGQASAAFATELRFAFSEALSPEGALRFQRMARLWPGDEQTTNGLGPVRDLQAILRYLQPAPTLVAPWAIAHGTPFRGHSALRAEIVLDPDRQGGRFRLPFPLPNTRPGAAYQLGLLADEGPILSESGRALGRSPQGLPPTQGLPGELLRAVAFEAEASLAQAPELPPALARQLGRLRPTWRFHLPQDHSPPKLLGASALAEGEDLLFKLRFDEPLVAFDPVASEAGGRADASLRGTGDLLKAFGFAFAEKAGELDGTRLEGEPAATWDPVAQATPPDRKAELRLAASARVDQLAGAPNGSVLIELPSALPQELWLRVRGRAQALKGLEAWALWVGAVGDPVGNRRNAEQSQADLLRLRL